MTDAKDDACAYAQLARASDRHPEYQSALRMAERVFAAVPTVSSREALNVITGAILMVVTRLESETESRIRAARKAERETYALEIKIALEQVAARGPGR